MYARSSNNLEKLMAERDFSKIKEILCEPLLDFFELTTLVDIFITEMNFNAANTLLDTYYGQLPHEEPTKWFFLKGKLYHLQGNLKEALEALKTADELGLASNEWNFVYKIKFLISEVLLKLGQLSLAIELLTTFLAKIEPLGEHAFLTALLNQISWLYNRKGDSENALVYSLRAIKTFNKQTEDKVKATSYKQLSTIYYNKGEHIVALKYAEHAIELVEKLNDHYSTASCVNMKGMIYLSLSRYTEALPVFFLSLQKLENAQQNAIETPNYGIAMVKNNIGITYRHLGQFSEAINYLRDSLEFFEQIASPQDISMALGNFLAIHVAQGYLDQALEEAHRVLELKHQVGNNLEISLALTDIGSVYVEKGYYLEARKYYEQALAIVRQYSTNVLEMAGLIFDIIMIDYLSKTNIQESAIVKEFPKPPFDTEKLTNYWSIILAMQYQQQQDFHSAIILLTKTQQSPELSFETKMWCYERLAELYLTQWQNKGSSTHYNLLKDHLDSWVAICDQNRLTPNLCKAKLLQGKLAQIHFQFEESMQYLQESLIIAQKQGLPLHAKLLQEEITALSIIKVEKESLSTEDKQHFEKNHLQQFKSYLQELQSILNTKTAK